MEIGIAFRPKAGELVCGDSHLVKEEDGVTLIAVVDGLGHGEVASVASRAAIDFVADNHQMELVQLVRRCHAALRGTRGGVIGIARIDSARDCLEFVGVGNIEFRAISENDIKPFSTNGIIGYNMRKVMKFDYNVTRGDLIALFSDGISSRFDLHDFAKGTPQQMADAILKVHGKDIDDATIVVARHGDGGS